MKAIAELSIMDLAETSAVEAIGLRVPNVMIGRTSLVVLADAGEQDYERLDAMLETVGGSALWWWGDYLVHLASVRGVPYAQAKAASSYSPSALWTAAWVCRRVDRSRRRQALTFSHHQEVAALDPADQEIWLGKAEQNAWSSKQLRAEIRQSKATHSNGREQAPADQRASRASEGFEIFSMWYQAESPRFTPEQRAEWDQAIEPLAAEYVARISDADLARLLDARNAGRR